MDVKFPMPAMYAYGIFIYLHLVDFYATCRTNFHGGNTLLKGQDDPIGRCHSPILQEPVK